MNIFKTNVNMYMVHRLNKHLKGIAAIRAN